jgi:hypothetical protein
VRATVDEIIQLQVDVSGQSAAIVSEVRSERKVQLCHRSMRFIVQLNPCRTSRNAVQ